MIRILTFLLILTAIFNGNAQVASEENAIKNTINTFFDGLHKGDSTLVSSTLYSSVKIQTTRTQKDGKKILIDETKQQLLSSIASKKPEDVYLEKLLSWDIKIDGNLASVWTPYEFYFNGKFSHCGANSFQLFNDNGAWKIIYLVDMRRRGNCQALTNKK